MPKKDKELDGNENDELKNKELENKELNNGESVDPNVEGAEKTNDKVENKDGNDGNDGNNENPDNKLENVDDKIENVDDKLIKDEKVNNTLNDENVVGGADTSTQKDKIVTCLFLINVKYNTDIKKIGESIELDNEEALFLETNRIVQIVK